MRRGFAGFGRSQRAASAENVSSINSYIHTLSLMLDYPSKRNKRMFSPVPMSFEFDFILGWIKPEDSRLPCRALDDLMAASDLGRTVDLSEL